MNKNISFYKTNAHKGHFDNLLDKIRQTETIIQWIFCNKTLPSDSDLKAFRTTSKFMCWFVRLQCNLICLVALFAKGSKKWWKTMINNIISHWKTQCRHTRRAIDDNNALMHSIDSIGWIDRALIMPVIAHHIDNVHCALLLGCDIAWLYWQGRGK